MIAGATPAQAEEITWSNFDDNTSIYNWAEFDVEFVGLAESAVRDDSFVIYVQFEGPIPADAYSSTVFDNYAGVGMDVNLDGNTDLYMFTEERDLITGNVIPTQVWDSNNSRFLSCDADYSKLTDYLIGFRLQKSCAQFGSRLGLEAFANDGVLDSVDFVPDIGFFNVSIPWASGSGSIATPVVSDGETSSSFRPREVNTTRYEVDKPGSNPEDLVSLAATVTDSVVQLVCGNAAGTGWAADSTPSAAMKSSGEETFIVTNHHVIESCTNGSLVNGTDADGATFTARVVSYSASDDVAGLVTRHSLPSLEWLGEKPAVGWWSGVIGNPYELTGALSTGVVSQVGDGYFTTTAPLNPGNSGGPVFDNQGRVMGIATSKRIDSEGIGFAGSSELICEWLITCSTQAWSSNLPSAPEEEIETPIAQQPSDFDNLGPADGEFSAWTKMMADGESIKFYAKYLQIGDKVQFMVQDSSGSYKQYAWKRIDSGDLTSEGHYTNMQNGIYFIRTLDLNPGKNRVRIYVNGELYWGTKTYVVN